MYDRSSSQIVVSDHSLPYRSIEARATHHRLEPFASRAMAKFEQLNESILWLKSLMVKRVGFYLCFDKYMLYPDNIQTLESKDP